jgi:hypothetical protein
MGISMDCRRFLTAKLFIAERFEEQYPMDSHLPENPSSHPPSHPSIHLAILPSHPSSHPSKPSSHPSKPSI